MSAVGPVELAAAAAVAVGAAAQAVTGFGFSLVCAPLLTLALGAADGVRLVNVLAVAVNLLVLSREWRRVAVARVPALLVPAVAAAAVVGPLAHGASAGALDVSAGALVLAAVAVLGTGVRVHRLRGRVGAVLAGAVGGAMNIVGGVGGPALAGYATNADWPPGQVRATLAAGFLGINVVSVAVRGVGPLGVGFGVALVAVLAAGFAAGAVVAARLGDTSVRRSTLLLAAAGGAAAMARGLW